MAKCYYCEKQAALNCGICFTPICDDHKHPVNRWHNAFHASYICEGCYRLKEKKRKIVLVPIVAVSAFVIAKSMNVQWGLTQPSMWGFFFALSTILVVVMGAGVIYQFIDRSTVEKIAARKLIPAVLLWAVLYLIYHLLSV